MFVKRAFAAILGIATLTTGLTGPANAAMMIAPPSLQEITPLAPIQVRDHFRSGNEVIFRNGTRYWNGHRGYRHFRDGYSRHRDGWWYPRSAFGFGIVIAPRPTYRYVERAIPGRVSPAHIDWCHDRYRSYRSYDNSWQPNHGSRRVCRSPYW